jgi:hypothetical protein
MMNVDETRTARSVTLFKIAVVSTTFHAVVLDASLQGWPITPISIVGD